MKLDPAKSRLPREIVAEASSWFIEFRSGDLRAPARDRFIEWLRRSPQHVQAYLEVAGAWAELPQSDPESRIDADALIARARATADILRSPAISASFGAPRNRQHSKVLVAASIVVGALLLGILGFRLAANHLNVYTTGVGEQRSIRLADGSTVDLNALSRIKVRISGNSRDIDLLEGQALFQAAPDSWRPFIVHSAGTQIRAIGTRFDVYRKETGTVVTVLEGRVAVTAPATSKVAAQQQSLAAGQQVIASAQTIAPARSVDVLATTAWVQKRMMFEETPLADVALEFNRYNPRRLIIDDAALAGTRVSGVYSSTDPASLVRFLRDQPGIEVMESGREIRILRRESSSPPPLSR